MVTLFDSRKRKSSGFERDESASKRQRQQQGQHSCLGVTGSDRESEDVRRYMESVRNEANALPHIFGAPLEQVDNDKESIPRGYYSDGAYVAAPPTELTLPSDSKVANAEPAIVPRDAGIKRMMSLYSTLTTVFSHATPSPQGQVFLDTNFDRKKAQDWRKMLQNEDPKPAHIVSLNSDSVLKLLTFTMTMVKKGENVSKHTGCWTWALLPKLPHPGTMDREAVANVRWLAKQAIWLRYDALEDISWERRVRFGKARIKYRAYEGILDPVHDEEFQAKKSTKTPKAQQLTQKQIPNTIPIEGEDQVKISGRDAEVELEAENPPPSTQAADMAAADQLKDEAIAAEAEDGEIKGNEEDLEAAKKKLLERLEAPDETMLDANPTEELTGLDYNTMTMYDMIIIVAGEKYGQRDLLEYLWSD